MVTDVWHYFRHCPRCGQPLALTDEGDGPELRCTSDGFTFYQNPHSAVSAIIRDERDRVLMVKRAKEPGLGSWDLPGGFIQWGEEPRDAIIREVREELGATFVPTGLIGSFHDWYDHQDLRTSVSSTVYTGTCGELGHLNEEIASTEWFPLTELPTNIAFNSITQALSTLTHTS